jgi:mannan endo-1,4-beta-mannosidase
MLEYCQGEHRYLERPVGTFKPNMVRLWDDLFALCEQYGLRILATPYDTFWMWIRWKHHPYNKKNGGVCDKRSQWLLCPAMRQAIKDRLSFATERWGRSGVLFAWDIWNEIHPAHAGDSAEVFNDFVEDISSFLRQTEMRLHGRAHLQTVSTFDPVIDQDERIAYCTFCHPALDFASVHFYEKGAIDNPKNTVDAAFSAGRLTRRALSNMHKPRPFFDSEHGPIHAFKDRHKTLPEPFDDEYFKHIQWAHLASGGAGGGMRWPNRNPHSLTLGMRKAQKAMAAFLPLIDWQRFRCRNLNHEIVLSDRGFGIFGCGDTEQAVVWILRTDTIGAGGMLKKNMEGRAVNLSIPGLSKGHYRVVAFNTETGKAEQFCELDHFTTGPLQLRVPAIQNDKALAVRRLMV